MNLLSINTEKPIVAVLAGGYSAEYEISVQSGAEVVAHLQSSPFSAVLVKVEKSGWYAVLSSEDSKLELAVDKSDFSIQFEGEKLVFDAAFVAIHGTPGENGLLSGYLEMLGIPHTTSGVLGSSVAFNKAICKALLEDCGALMAKSRLIRTKDLELALREIEGLRYPLFVKPNQNGSSCGISRVKNAEEFGLALQAAAELDQEVLVEEAILGGTEVTCGIYTWDDRAVTLPLTEIVSGADHEFFNFEAKYNPGESEEITPARITQNDANAIRTITQNIYTKLQLSGLARADYIINKKGIWFLEVNTVPGLSGASIVPKMARAAGLSLTEFFSRLIEEAINSRESTLNSERNTGPKQGHIV